MKRKDIKVGGVYAAKVSGKITEVKVLEIRESQSYRAGCPHSPVILFDVVNQRTGRKTTFRSATKFRWEITPEIIYTPGAP